MAKKTKKVKINARLIAYGLLGIFLILAALFISQPGYLEFISPKPAAVSQIKEVNDDENALNTIPSDVIAALNQAKTTGNPVLGIRADGPSYHIPILIYHYVEHVKDRNDTIRIKLNTLPEILDKQIQTLVQAGYTFITASDLADILDGIKKPPPNPVILTFDDGYRDFYTDAFPILKKYNVKSVAYIISGFIDKPNNLTDKQLHEIANSGLVEIGSHTVHHPALASTSIQNATQEINDSKVQLEQKLGIPITTFAYPYGSFNIESIQLVKKAGYRTAISTIHGSEMSNSVRFFAYRLRPGAATGQELLNLLSH